MRDRLYAVYNKSLKKFANKGEVDSVKNAGYFGNKTKAQLKYNFFSEFPDYYSTLGAAKRQLKYCSNVFSEDLFCIIVYDVTEAEKYILDGDNLILAPKLGKLLYE